jgi:hypothetical protein
VTSISAGIFQNLGIAAVPAIALLNTVPYDYINKQYGLVTAAWDSPALWVVAVSLGFFGHGIGEVGGRCNRRGGLETLPWP